MPVLDEAVIRSLAGIFLLVIGIVTLIGFALPSQGKLTDWWRDSIAPWFGSMRILFPLILLACGVWLEWRRPETGWRRRLAAAAVAYVSLLGIVGLLAAAGPLEGKSGGRIGDWLARVLPGLITEIGALLVLTVVGVAALALGLDRPLRALFAGPLSGMKEVGVSLLGALATTLLAVPVGVLAARRSGRLPRLLERASYAGHALPGIVANESARQGGARLVIEDFGDAPTA